MKFWSSRCLNVNTGLVVGQVSVSQHQYFLIFFQIICREKFRLTFLRVNSSHNPFVPLNSCPLIVISLSVSTSIAESPIINESLTFRIPYCVSRKSYRHYVRTGYGAYVLSAKCLYIFLDKIITTIIVVVIFFEFGKRSMCRSPISDLFRSRNICRSR